MTDMETDMEQVAAEADRFESDFRRNHPVTWWATLLGPFVLTAAILAVLAMERGWDYVKLLLATAAATFFFFGRFVILGGEIAISEEERQFLSSETLAAMVFYMDLLTACLIGFHAGVMWRLPIIGRRLQLLVEQGRTLLAANPRVKGATFLSITAFVMFPLAATGSVGGSLFARLLGMSRLQTFLAVFTGSLLGCGVMYLGGTLITRYFDRSNPIVMFGGVVCVAVLIVVLARRFKKMTASGQH